MPETRPVTIADALAAAAARLAAVGVPEPRRDARLLLEHAAGLRREAILAVPERALGVDALAAYQSLVDRRCNREPVSRILGRREFWSLDFRLGPDCLDPRPDSETLVSAVLERLPDRDAALSLLDLGTGSGCLLLALLSELPRARGVGIDVSESAVRIARQNARARSLADRARFAVGDWGTALAGKFDVVVCNPPYIGTDEIAGLAPEVACYEPRRALDGGVDGLAAFRAIAPALPGHLSPGGVAALEVGTGQATAVTALLQASGLVAEGVFDDLSGTPRCLVSGLGNRRMSRQKKGWNGTETGLGSPKRSASVRLATG
jgi:release factor glutamine methyltransferase